MHNWDKFYIFVPTNYKDINMETKLCKKCGRELPLEQFELEHTAKGDIRRSTCRECRAEYRKNRRKEHPEFHVAQEARRIKRVREWQNSLKTSCIVCGESEPICIDWHHLNPSTKNFTIGANFSRARSLILSEIKKCVCLCANCHRKVHAGLIDLNNYITSESPLCTTGEGVTE